MDFSGSNLANCFFTKATVNHYLQAYENIFEYAL